MSHCECTVISKVRKGKPIVLGIIGAGVGISSFRGHISYKPSSTSFYHAYDYLSSYRHYCRWQFVLLGGQRHTVCERLGMGHYVIAEWPGIESVSNCVFIIGLRRWPAVSLSANMSHNSECSVYCQNVCNFFFCKVYPRFFRELSLYQCSVYGGNVVDIEENYSIFCLIRMCQLPPGGHTDSKLCCNYNIILWS